MGGPASAPGLLARLLWQDQSPGAGGVLTQPCVCCRILSLACSPNGASFVCSAAAPSLASQVDFSAPDTGSKGTDQGPGKLLLWDTKTMKQQVQALPLWVSPWVCVGSHSGLALPSF